MGVGFAVADFAGVCLNGAVAAPGEFLGAVGRAIIAVLGVAVVAGLAEPRLDDAIAAGGFDLGVVVVEVVKEAEFEVIYLCWL